VSRHKVQTDGYCGWESWLAAQTDIIHCMLPIKMRSARAFSVQFIEGPLIQIVRDLILEKAVDVAVDLENHAPGVDSILLLKGLTHQGVNLEAIYS